VEKPTPAANPGNIFDFLGISAMYGLYTAITAIYGLYVRSRMIIEGLRDCLCCFSRLFLRKCIHEREKRLMTRTLELMVMQIAAVLVRECYLERDQDRVHKERGENDIALKRSCAVIQFTVTGTKTSQSNAPMYCTTGMPIAFKTQ